MDIVDVVRALPVEVWADKKHVEACVVGVGNASEALNSTRRYRASNLVGLPLRDAALLRVPAFFVVRLLSLPW